MPRHAVLSYQGRFLNASEVNYQIYGYLVVVVYGSEVWFSTGSVLYSQGNLEPKVYTGSKGVP